MKKYTIELSFDELCLIERSLELYGRVSMLQFDYMNSICNSLTKLIWKKDISQEFRNKTDELKLLFGYTANSNPGIFNTEHVSDDARIAIDLYQTIRHQRWLDDTDPDKNKHHTVLAYPADICQLAGMKIPDFKFTK